MTNPRVKTTHGKNGVPALDAVDVTPVPGEKWYQRAYNNGFASHGAETRYVVEIEKHEVVFKFRKNAKHTYRTRLTHWLEWAVNAKLVNP